MQMLEQGSTPGLCDYRAGVLTSNITQQQQKDALISPNMIDQEMRVGHLLLGKSITWDANKLTLLMLSHFPFKNAFQ